MSTSVNQLSGISLGASDGVIGHVKDFHYDDRSGALRYLVADMADIFTGVSRGTDKWLWFVEAHSQSTRQLSRT